MNMTVFSFLAVSFFMNVIAAVFLICAVVLILVILIQKGKGGGLSGALAGGAMSGILGSKSKEPLTWFTIALVAVFLTLAVVMAKFYKPVVRDFGAGPSPQPVQQAPSGSPMLPPARELAETSEIPSGLDDIPMAPEGEGMDANSLGE